MNIAVIFFGIARAVHLSIDSIRRNIYAPNADLDLTIIASLNVVDEVHNPRNDEFQEAMDAPACFALGADFYVLRAQQDDTIAPLLALAQQQPDAFDNNWISTRNMLHQLHSLRAGWIAATTLPDRIFDAFLFVRPDQIYLDEIRIADLLETFNGTRNILLPDWHSWSGFNDRIALADPIAARCYAERLLLVAEYCRSRPLHAERLVAYALAKGQCKAGLLPARAHRLRANGTSFDEDFTQAVIPIPRQPGLISLWDDLGGGVTVHEATGAASRRSATAPPAEPARPGVAASPPIVPAPLPAPQPAPLPAPLGISFTDRLRRVMEGSHRRVAELAGRPYTEALQHLHDSRHVTRYLEIGVDAGDTLRLARDRAVAIDPSCRLPPDFLPARPGTRLFAMTSDDYFAGHDPRDVLGGAIQLAFIDGMHRSEFVLRDFINAERHCAPDSVIVLHDVIPLNFEMSERTFRKDDRVDKAYQWHWTGDVWRMLPVLRAMRPDLRIDILDCPFTGLAVITNLNPGSRILADSARDLSQALTETVPTEAQFWQFIDSVQLADSRSFTL